MPQSPEGLLRPYLEDLVPFFYVESHAWTAIGLSGAAIFGSRFIIQWLRSEKEKKLVVPALFWHLSFWGSVINLIYALHIDKLPIILGSFFLPVLYGRNLVLLKKSRGKTQT